jgi:hypothetical protein
MNADPQPCQKPRQKMTFRNSISGRAASTWRSYLVDDYSEVVEAGEGHNTVVAGKNPGLRQVPVHKGRTNRKLSTGRGNF